MHRLRLTEKPLKNQSLKLPIGLIFRLDFARQGSVAVLT